MLVKIFSRKLLGGALEREYQRLGLHFAQQQLDRLVVQLEEVFPDEHLVHDPLRELGVELLDAGDDSRLVRARHEIQHLGRGAHPAHGALLDVLAAGEELGEHVVQLAQGRRLDAVERRDPQQHVVPRAVGQVPQDFRGLLALEVHQDGPR
jgi:hypothetical protein